MMETDIWSVIAFLVCVLYQISVDHMTIQNKIY